MSPQERAMRKAFVEGFHLVCGMSMNNLREIVADRANPANLVVPASIIVWAVEKGNPALFSEIFNRILGRVRTQEEFDEDDPYKGLSKEEFIRLAKERIEQLEHQVD